ncbi:orotidine-5'-phosphate decarboxylase [Arcticibacter tournemirensis]|uniref:Orotidine-5'-phosphate decarboxylase n=1 Tax=Arcticibacter tournemirensis TaxID=699437 RepID=A0A5M9HH43_9SPHI|nr:orotidine-5'-phosphate decarboxylase [Arcticibacter tournemirensis]KAA8486312.1 orotidine-5'-phosphate decarboxylase [Arcticibacter tournemirensis]TQM52124.1 orotidine-5'-phosphate decarboxylase [Arcticibacter tournemirensis]
MKREQLIDQIRLKKSFLCIGLDTDIDKIPNSLLDTEDPVFEFNKKIIDATKDFCVSYKINTAFYESRGLAGWTSLIKTFEYLPKDCFSIADAKRGDIGNTSEMYAKAFFDPGSSGMSFDSVTVAPYMGADSVKPFLSFEDKWVILLALTSNQGSKDFQFLTSDGGGMLFESVLNTAKEWGSDENMMFVVGATRGEAFLTIRKHVPNHFLLVPGVGAQGGSLDDVCKFGMNQDCGLLVNSSRAIIYASSGEDFAEAARREAKKVQQEMAAWL